MTDLASVSHYILKEETKFRASTGAHVLKNIGECLNFLRDKKWPLGTVFESMLNEDQFINEMGSSWTWVLCDGRSIGGTALNVLTGSSNAPDYRGLYLRDQNSGSGNIPEGNISIGAFLGDEIKAHTHTAVPTFHFDVLATHIAYTDGTNNFTTTIFPWPYEPHTNTGSGTFTFETSTTIEPVGGDENRPKTMTLNYFLRTD